MPKLGHKYGVSYQEEGSGKFRVRWRQWEEEPNGSRVRRQRSVFAYSMEEVKQLALDIEKALDDRGWWEAKDVPVRPAELNLERVAADWIHWKKSVRRARPNTVKNLASSMRRFFRTLRRVHGLGEDEVVPGRLLTERDLVRVQDAWTEPPFDYGEGTVYQTIAAVVGMWKWAADEPAYAALCRPPRELERVMPPTPLYETPEIVPTWAELDSVLRRVTQTRAQGLAIIMRYTGLRIEQASYVYAEDFDPVGGTLLIRKGKSRREQNLMRRVPASPHLFVDIGPWVNSVSTGPLFPDHKATDQEGNPIPIVSYRNQTPYITEAWRAATKAKEARLEAWSPPNRRRNRPDHAFRATFQAEIERAGMSDRVIDWLVGHSSKTTRGKHYNRPVDEVLRQAVDTVPAIDWGEARTNVVRLA